ncbi:MAG TPA: M28 family peptidase [Candidatus Dormibacteraeota bacterium]|nr:M28 family peptidase [Candidatus Dormibacteraeota bacterium]
MFESFNAATGPNWKLRFVVAVISFALGAGGVSLWRMTQMPLRSYRGPLPSSSATQQELASRLAQHVNYLSATIGERNLRRDGSLKATTDYLRSNLAALGYSVREQTYTVEGHAVSNLEAERPGTASDRGIVVVGSHYDSVSGTVGADDNASGVAATLELARMLQGSKLEKTIRFVFFVNEEPPYFQTESMGSVVYAKKLRQDGVRVSAMISLETLGFYSDAPGSQQYPAVLSLFYPDRGNFIGFVGNSESRDLVRRSIRKFRETTMFPSEGVDAPATWPGIGWSDHWSFWQQGYPAIMITDTATFRDPYYHTAGDTFEKIDFEKMARVVDGVKSLLAALANQ